MRHRAVGRLPRHEVSAEGQVQFYCTVTSAGGCAHDHVTPGGGFCDF